MSDIKLVLTDMDGTVVQLGKHLVSERIREAVIACEDAGVKVAAVTGRPYEMAQPVLEILGFEDLGIFDNGASIRSAKTGELVWSKWLEPAELRTIASVVLPYASKLHYTPEFDYHEVADDEAERIELIDKPAPYVFVLAQKDKIDEISAKLAEVPQITFYTAPSIDGLDDFKGVQITHIQADKFHGVAALRAITDISKEHILAIGDGDNDVSLFQNAGLKIAMGNATDELKAAADYVVGTVDDDGFAEAMERFVLGRNLVT